MSLDAMHHVKWNADVKSSSEKFLLMTIADICDDSNECYGAVSYLTAATMMGATTVKRLLKQLVERGELEVVVRGGISADGTNIPNRWRMPRVVAGRGSMVDLPGVHGGPTRGSMVDPKYTYSNTKVNLNINEGVVGGDSTTSRLAQASPSPQPKPLCPSGKVLTKKSQCERNPAFNPSSLSLPHGPRFRAAWGDWCHHRATGPKSKRAPLTETAAKVALRKLGAVGEADAIAALEDSIISNWTGVFPKDSGKRFTEPAVNPRQLKPLSPPAG
jgi:hypothetical protein